MWDGLEVVQQDAALTGVSNLVRDVTGEVAIQTADGLLSGGDRWGLTDRLGSTVAQTSGSRVSQVVSYSDWGIPTFATVGYNSAAGFTGELGDGVTGLSEYFARAYDPWSASWLQADPYRGTLDAPGTQNRYGYAEGNPVTLQDYYGYSTGRMQVETRQGPRPPSPGSRTADGWVRHFEANPDAPRPSGYTGTWPARHDTCGIEGKPSCGTNSGTTPEKPHMCPLSWEPCSTELYWQEIAVSSIQGFAMAFAFRGRPGATTPRVPGGALSGNRPTNPSASSVGTGHCSFSGETGVLLADGQTKPISEIEVGDEVLAADPETGEQSSEEVTHLWVHEDDLVDLGTDAGTLATTEDHPFWNETDRQWQAASDLDPGDRLLTADGTTLTTTGLAEDTAREGTAYNLTVDEHHTYYVVVGDVDVLVHNTCPSAGGLSPNQMNQAIIRGQAPNGLGRVDIPKTYGEQVHIHFENGAALNIDGTWKHGSTELTRVQRDWLRANGWNVD